jgi:hypothetical protein
LAVAGTGPEDCTPPGNELCAEVEAVAVLAAELAAVLAPLLADVLAPAVLEWPVVAGAVRLGVVCVLVTGVEWLLLGWLVAPNEIVCTAVLVGDSFVERVWCAAISHGVLVQSMPLNDVFNTGEGELRFPLASAFATTTVLKSLNVNEHWLSAAAPALHSTM